MTSLDNQIAKALDDAGVERVERKETATAAKLVAPYQRKINTLERKLKSAQNELDQQRRKKAKLAEDKEKAQKDANHYRTEVANLQRKLESNEYALSGGRKARSESPKVTSDDGSTLVHLVGSQVVVAIPDQWLVISSVPLDRAKGHETQFFPAIDYVLNGINGKFAHEAIYAMAYHWRKYNEVLRSDDLDLPESIHNKLIAYGWEFVKDIQPDNLTDVPGIAEKTAEKVCAAIKKAEG